MIPGGLRDEIVVRVIASENRGVDAIAAVNAVIPSTADDQIIVAAALQLV